jgi:hypothetical protein
MCIATTSSNNKKNNSVFHHSSFSISNTKENIFDRKLKPFFPLREILKSTKMQTKSKL